MNPEKLTSIVNILISRYYPHSSIKLYINDDRKFILFSDMMGHYQIWYATDDNLIREVVKGIIRTFPRIPKEAIEEFFIGFAILAKDEATKLFTMLELTT